MLTPEELEPSEEDMRLGERLVAEGWKSTSSKFRHIARFRIAPPNIEELMKPDALHTYHGRRLKKLWEQHRSDGWWLRMGPDQGDDGVEKMVLTVKEYRAFRLAGGQTA